MSVTRKRRRYLVTAMFDIEADGMVMAKELADTAVLAAIAPYVRVKDKDSGLAFEHFADGKWKKVPRE